MANEYLDGSLNPINVVNVVKHNIEFAKEHPDYFHPEGLLVFCGSQGSGKTLSSVLYNTKILADYKMAVFCTNVAIKGYSVNCKYETYTRTINNVEHIFVDYISLVTDELVRRVDSFFRDGEQQCIIEDYSDVKFYELPLVVAYDGIDCIKNLINGEYGVLYYIDEIHLEFNSLESKNIPIDIMVEVSQQRKQRKHIVGTSQVYGRLAKPFREQIKNVVLCSCILKVLQYNILIDGDKSQEVEGKLVTESTKKYIWFHSPELYNSYDTFAKMKRYRKEWKGVSRNAGGY